MDIFGQIPMHRVVPVFVIKNADGGLDMLQSLATPYRHTGFRFNPTGGITPETMNNWLNHGFVFAVGGSWIASASDISEHRWDRITVKAEAASQVAQG